MTDWQTRVRRHLREQGMELSDPVVEELADHLEDAWAARRHAHTISPGAALAT